MPIVIPSRMYAMRRRDPPLIYSGWPLIAREKSVCACMDSRDTIANCQANRETPYVLRMCDVSPALCGGNAHVAPERLPRRSAASELRQINATGRGHHGGDKRPVGEFRGRLTCPGVGLGAYAS